MDITLLNTWELRAEYKKLTEKISALEAEIGELQKDNQALADDNDYLREQLGDI